MVSQILGEFKFSALNEVQQKLATELLAYQIYEKRIAKEALQDWTFASRNTGYPHRQAPDDEIRPEAQKIYNNRIRREIANGVDQKRTNEDWRAAEVQFLIHPDALVWIPLEGAPSGALPSRRAVDSGMRVYSSILLTMC